MGLAVREKRAGRGIPVRGPKDPRAVHAALCTLRTNELPAVRLCAVGTSAKPGVALVAASDKCGAPRRGAIATGARAPAPGDTDAYSDARLRAVVLDPGQVVSLQRDLRSAR